MATLPPVHDAAPRLRRPNSLERLTTRLSIGVGGLALLLIPGRVLLAWIGGL